MDLELKDKIAFVTGASSGIGAAVSLILAEEGADVVLVYHQDRAGAEKQAHMVESRGREAWPCQMDITRTESISDAIQRLKKEIKGIDLLILSAGYNHVVPFQDILPAEWEQVLNTNLNGVFYLVQALLPVLNQGASITTVASVAAHTGAPHHMHYAAAKAGLVNLTKSLARALGPNIRVNCVAPGIALTPMGEDTVKSLPADYAESKLLVGRFATPEEIARCIVFVASPVAGFMTGSTIDINGGRELR